MITFRRHPISLAQEDKRLEAFFRAVTALDKCPMVIKGLRGLMDEGRTPKEIFGMPFTDGRLKGKPGGYLRARWRDGTRALISYGLLGDDGYAWEWSTVFNERDEVVENRLLQEYSRHWRYRYKRVLRQWVRALEET